MEQMIIIVSGAVTPPAEIIKTGSYRQLAPPDEPSHVLVEEIELGY